MVARQTQRRLFPFYTLGIALLTFLLFYAGVFLWERDQPLPQLLRRGASVQESLDGKPSILILTGPQFIDRDLKLVGRLPELNTLDIRDTGITEQALLAELDHWPRIHSLKLRGFTCSTKGIETLMTLPQLRSLALQACTGVDPDQLAALAEQSPLEELQLADLPMTPAQYERVGKASRVSLTIEPRDILSASAGFKVSWAHTAEEATFHLVALRSVDASDIESVEPADAVVSITVGEQHFGPGPSTVRLHTSAFSKLSRFPNLARLVLNQPVGDAEFAGIGRIPALAALSIRNGEFSDAGMESLRDHPALTSLWVESPNVTGPGIDVVRSLKRLESLWLIGFDGCDPDAFSDPADLPRLRSVRVENLGLRDQHLRFLDGCPELREVYLWGNELTEAAIPILESMPNLRRCDITGNRIPDATVDAFWRRLEKRPPLP